MSTGGKIYFVTDAHLGLRADVPVAGNEKKLVRWLDSIQADCGALYMLGDMIDFWYEYKEVVPKGFVRFFGKLAEFTDAGIPVYWFAGNHDLWLFSYVQQEMGIVVYNEAQELDILGKSFYIAHGDGLGYAPFSFRIMNGIFHSPFCQALFKILHPDLGISFGLRWSRHSYYKRKTMELAYLGEGKEHLIQFAKKHLTTAKPAPDFYVFGHRHILLDLQLTRDCRLVIPGDWIREFSYATFDGKDLVLEHFEE
jgi:UDP-2,3-diacylglucosamine hydrolase